jgi:DNA polymerase III alpha subunit (gram-positive type)
VEIADRHRASGDALATAEVLRGLLRDVSHRGVHTWDDLDDLLAARTARSRRRTSGLPRASDGADGA